ncbi:MAG: threonine--tRNA ligase [Clostridia bacterium]|nr:threonine--tRNA ligase [Clostridia bacterium]
MIKITLKDGSILEVESGSTVLEVAKKISEGLARVATCASVNGKTVDLRYELNEDAELNIYTFDNDLEGKKAYWHTTAHIMSQAVKRLFPHTKLTIGPSIDEGFYYDFDPEENFTDEDKTKIEEEMKKIIKEDLAIERFELPRADAIKLMEERGESYKVLLIEDLPEDEPISFYQQGEFVDLCRGPHLMSTGKVKAVKILSSSSAYWRGDAKNKALQRIYGISFTKNADLEEYVTKLEEAKERDHRKLGKELGIFMTHDLTGKGLPMFLPNGYIIWEELENYIKGKEKKLGYKHVLTPPLGTVDLYKTSGHWDHYKDNMFPKMEVEGEEFVLRPMNCPHHMMIYANDIHSYRDLPIRIGEIARDCRFEASGTLKGIERVRTFCQNDAHLFVTREQIESEFKSVVDLILDVYKELDIKNYRFELSLRDPEDTVKYYPDDEMWNTAEDTLRQVLNDIGIEYIEKKGEAAFYGPKLDVQVKPAVGNEYTLSTCQLDFCLPMRFELAYIDKDGQKKTPVVLHRAILGSIDRFMAFYLEETKGALPTWLSPVQAKVLPISTDKHMEYAEKVYRALKDAGVRVELDDRSEKIGYKIREAQVQKIPYMLVLGDKEIEAGAVGVRNRKDGDLGQMPLDQFVEKIKEEIEKKSL